MFSKENPKLKAIAPLLILLLPFAVYSITLLNGFVSDDNFVVLENKWLTDIRYIPDILSSSVWSFAKGSPMSNYYRPVMHLVLMAEHAVFGLAPWGYHLFNIAFHCANSALVYLITAFLFSEKGYGLNRGATVGAAPLVAALVFALNPLSSQAVAWVSAVPELSYTLFFLFSFYMYLRAGEAERPRHAFYLLSLASYFVSMFCKEPSIVLPGVIAAYEYSKNGLASIRKLPLWLPYGILAAVYLFIRSHAIGGIVSFSSASFTPHDYLLNLPVLFGRYFWKFVFPVSLNASYVLHPVKTLAEPRAAAALLFCAAYFLCILVFRRSATGFALLLILFTLLPAFYLPVIPGGFAERYFYLPALGASIILMALLSRVDFRSKTACTALLALFALYAVQDIRRAVVWKDDYSLWKDSLAQDPENIAAHINLGRALVKRGDRAEAITEFKAALSLDPGKKEPLIRLAYLYRESGDYPNAINYFNEYLKAEPGSAEGHYNLAMAYGATGDDGSAVAHYIEALKINPNDENAHYNLAFTYQKLKDYENAAAHYRAVITNSPASVDAHYNLANVYAEERRYAEAAAEYEEALRINPDYLDASARLARMKGQSGGR